MSEPGALRGRLAAVVAGHSTISAGILAARLRAVGAPVVPTGVCLECQLRVPVLRSAVCARHWANDRIYPLGQCCAGAGSPAGLIMIAG